MNPDLSHKPIAKAKKVLTMSLTLTAVCIICIAASERRDYRQKLTGKWNIYKTVEYFQGWTRVYHDTSYQRNGRHMVKSNSLGGKVEFLKNGTGNLWCWKLNWEISRDLELIVKEDTAQPCFHHYFLFGTFKMIELEDSTAVLFKNISRDGKWTRTFYMKRQ